MPNYRIMCCHEGDPMETHERLINVSEEDAKRQAREVAKKLSGYFVNLVRVDQEEKTADVRYSE